MRTDFFYDSCGVGKIHGCCWWPEGTPKAVVQIVHGIAEYAYRYARFAECLNAHGYLVVAEDHPGHGLTRQRDGAKGYFGGGWFGAIDNLLALKHAIQEEYPDVPYVFYGHSMGSFMVRTLLAYKPECELAGCVICGTGWLPEIVVNAGRAIAVQACKRMGEKIPNAKLQALMFSGYNKKVERPRTEYDWLSRDASLVDAYVEDPLCGFTVSSGLLRDMLTGIRFIQNKDNLKKMNTKIPVFFVAGGDDPVGDYGKGVRKAAAKFEEVGMQNVSCKIYPLCRHEILNEINQEEVFDDVLEWLESIL